MNRLREGRLTVSEGWQQVPKGVDADYLLSGTYNGYRITTALPEEGGIVFFHNNNPANEVIVYAAIVARIFEENGRV